MGYFPNGTSGQIFEEEFCDHCLHNEGACPVWTAHMIYNYDECNNPNSILHMLIPKDCSTCNMFVKKVET